jgi:diaminopropionate ammonia-lyase
MIDCGQHRLIIEKFVQVPAMVLPETIGALPYCFWMRYENKFSDTATPVRRFRADCERPEALLKNCPVYQRTPLCSLVDLRAEVGVGEVWVKDETGRMGLGSFKALGGIFAVAQMLADTIGTTDLLSECARAQAAEMTFITASAGNHGLSVATGARLFGAQCVIVLNKDVSEAFADRVRQAGGQVVRVDGSYEDSVCYALDAANKNKWLLLADGSWDGYTERPALVMEGYTVLAEECRSVFDEADKWPTHVFLQAGVGGLAAAVAANIRQHWQVQPTIVVVEPDSASCLMASVEAGTMRQVEGRISNMGRLDCKVPSLLAFESLRADADFFVTVSDRDAAAAAKLYADHGVQTTPSGAASLAALKTFRPGPASRCLLIATEGPEKV